MANYYQKFSIALALPEPAAQYALALATAADAIGNHEAVADPELEAAARQINADEFTTGCDWRLEAGELLVSTDDSPQIELAASILQATLAKFDIAGAITIEWANDASKPLLDAFGGGAVIITKDDQRWMTTARWLDDETSKMDVAVLNGPMARTPTPADAADTAVAAADALDRQALLDAATQGAALGTCDED